MARPQTITDALLGEVRDIVAAKRGATVQELCDVEQSKVVTGRALLAEGGVDNFARTPSEANPSTCISAK